MYISGKEVAFDSEKEGAIEVCLSSSSHWAGSVQRISAQPFVSLLMSLYRSATFSWFFQYSVWLGEDMLSLTGWLPPWTGCVRLPQFLLLASFFCWHALVIAVLHYSWSFLLLGLTFQNGEQSCHITHSLLRSLERSLSAVTSGITSHLMNSSGLHYFSTSRLSINFNAGFYMFIDVV